ncbi:hypothetical protein, partial [Pseudoalteromonas peptidolytica]|uniref:hypothetical protein n=1 Tax=Pseudoalteromonas peptidolytica TaxID=61150 RepID=UPI00298EBADB
NPLQQCDGFFAVWYLKRKPHKIINTSKSNQYITKQSTHREVNSLPPGHQQSAALVGGGLPAEKKPFAAMQRVFCYVGFEKKTSQDNQHLEKQSIHYKAINTLQSNQHIAR